MYNDLEVMTMIKKISREDEREIPEFGSHYEARQWFKNKYGEDFFLVSSESIDKGKRRHIYNLVLDRKTYDRSMEELLGGVMRDAQKLLESYQTIEITDGGGVHIVH